MYKGLINSPRPYTPWRPMPTLEHPSSSLSSHFRHWWPASNFYTFLWLLALSFSFHFFSFQVCIGNNFGYRLTIHNLSYPLLGRDTSSSWTLAHHGNYSSGYHSGSGQVENILTTRLHATDWNYWRIRTLSIAWGCSGTENRGFLCRYQGLSSQHRYESFTCWEECILNLVCICLEII